MAEKTTKTAAVGLTELGPPAQVVLPWTAKPTAGAAEKAAAPLSAWIAAATRGTTPDRISTIPALRAEHLEELSTRFVTSNAEIRSWSNCKACHPGAVEGRFSEHEIRIPR